MTKTVLESLVADGLEAIRAEIVDLAASDKGTAAERRSKALEPQGEYSKYKRPRMRSVRRSFNLPPAQAHGDGVF